MKALARITCGLLAALVLAPATSLAQAPAAAADTSAVKTLDDLLKKTRSASQREAELDAARERDFRTTPTRSASRS